jgi:hypothetical protein
MVKSKSTEQASEEVQTYFFPETGVSIEATSYEEALEAYQSKKKEVGDAN